MSGPDQKKPGLRLGQMGQMMKCRECGEPLTLFSMVDPDDEWDETPVIYVHPRERFIPQTGEVEPLTDECAYDHEAVPVPTTPLEANVICDFCASPHVRYVFIPRKQIRMHDPETGATKDYSSPWHCCGGCLKPVREKDLSATVRRAVSSKHSSLKGQAGFIVEVQKLSIRRLQKAYFDSLPEGPFPMKIAPTPKKIGKPSSRRGM
ncbi:hypothetical protein ABZV77_11650 [Streptomyces sp. NPDC004732]|uniref:hypothetical protein n=1 Tax=Streptomyces sp. NPDC004732 TaxID=3154290 RepID=UPI0033B64F3E